MRKFKVEGMSCAACSARVEKAVSSVSGVEKCSVNLLTGDMAVFGNASDDDIVKAVTDAGYGIKNDNKKNQKNEEESETKPIKKRLIYSLFFLAVLMYVSMGYTMFSAPLPAFLERNPLSVALVQMLLTIIVMVINKKFFISGFKGAIKGAPNMDTLVSMGSGASFVYSTVLIFVMSDKMLSGGDTLHLLHGLYFESAAMILTLITLGKMLESRSKGKTTTALKGLMEIAPKTAIVIKNGKEEEVLIENIAAGDEFLVKPGGKIPVDGIILSGNSAIDESALTGESIPVDKDEGDSIFSGCINLSGYIKCRALKVGEDTTLSQIIKMVSDASATKAPAQKAADRVSAIFVPAVIIIAVISTVIWLLIEKSIGFALARGISTLVISCPCALGLATPVAIMVASGKGAKCGILFKTAQALEECGKVKTVAFDKTGTITKGEPEVSDILPFGNANEKELLGAAYSLEIKSEHPLARAIVKKAGEEGILAEETEKFEILPGNGLIATINDKKLFGGKYDFVSKNTDIPAEAVNIAEKLSENGKTPMFFAEENIFLGIIAVADTLKKDSENAISLLKKMGIKTVMITGDNKKTAHAIGEKVGIEEIYSDVLPGDKERIIRELKQSGRVAMVGDGINDAPALTSADTGIAIGAGVDIAIDAAEVVLMKNSLSDVAAAITLSRKTLKNIYENLFWAFIYNIVGIPLAAGVFIPLFGWELSPMFGAAAMSLSSFFVVSNALRLNRVNFEKTEKIKIKEKKNMKVTLKIEGMMCPHCEARVKQTLEGIDGVSQASPSHKAGIAEVTLSKEVDTKILIDAVVAQGYKVIE